MNKLSLKSVRLFADASGQQVVVGEVTFNYQYDDSPAFFPRVVFSFFDGAGRLAGIGAAYVETPENRRVFGTASYGPSMSHALMIGFFKVWTSIPAASVASYTFTSEAIAAYGSLPLNRVASSPVSIATAAGAFSTFSGTVSNAGTATATFVRGAVAGYKDGVIADVDYTDVNGSRYRFPCDLSYSDSAIPAGGSAPFTGTFSRDVDSVGRVAISYDEEGPGRTYPIGYDETKSWVQFVRPCGWTATALSPWIRIVSPEIDPRSSGFIELAVEPNPDLSPRVGYVDISGFVVAIPQGAAPPPPPPPPPPCAYEVRPIPEEMGGARKLGTLSVITESSCSWQVRSLTNEVFVVDLSSGVGSRNVTYLVERNLSTSSRQLAFELRNSTGSVVQTISVTQRPGISLPFDLNGDGVSDLLWQHETDGRIEAWLMDDNMQRIETVPIGPGVVSDTNWKIVGTGDLDRDQQSDIVWRNIADGRVAVWFMDGTALREGTLLSIPAVPDLAWRIGGVADINEDGSGDLVWHHTGDGRLAVWYMEGSTVIAGEPLAVPNPDTNWTLAAVEDMSYWASGGADLIWRHVDGRVAVWMLDRGTLIRGDLLVPATVFPDQTWQLRAVGDRIGMNNPERLWWQNIVTGGLAAWGVSQTLGPPQQLWGLPLSPSQVADTNWQIVGPR